MNREKFIASKENLTNLLIENLSQKDISEQDRKSILKLLELIDQYSYENRLQQKGLLSHSIIDSLKLDYSLGEKLINFDNEIK